MKKVKNRYNNYLENNPFKNENITVCVHFELKMRIRVRKYK